MNVINIHLDPVSINPDITINSSITASDIPRYTFDVIKQVQQFEGNKVSLMCRNTLADIYTIDYLPYLTHPRIVALLDNVKKNYARYYNDAFWLVTMLRIPLLCVHILENNLQGVLHLENDNLIYKNPNDVFKNMKGFAYPVVGPSMASAGILYISDVDSANILLQCFEKLLNRTEQELKTHTFYDWISEMVLLSYIREYQQNKHYVDLEILPTSVTTLLFDGASYGQYLAGTNNGHAQGFTDQNHYIGQALRKKEFDVKFEKAPHVCYNDKHIQLFNLHLHNKQRITEFMTI